MNIRKLLSEDSREELSEIYEKSWKYAYRGIIPDSFLDSIPHGKWAENADREGIHNLVLTEGGRLCGTCSYSASRFPEFPNEGEIIAIYLLPEFMGKGYGKMLLREAAAELSGMGFDKIFLWVLEENHPARRFYERNGFSPTGDFLDDNIGGKALREMRYTKTAPF
ncbi:MAG: GNAT family N-acetyltransferase [Oscillospiraceae bacterium]|nr:GNAT family N-acetyltransferase [Oscillospiraceae bacterium]